VCPSLSAPAPTVGLGEVEEVLCVVEEEVVVQVQAVGSEGRVDVGVGRDGRRHQHHSVHAPRILNLVVQRKQGGGDKIKLE